jgi:hypothetical protein
MTEERCTIHGFAGCPICRTPEPPEPEKEPRVALALPYWPWERAAWEQAADRAGLPLHEWLRRTLVHAARHSEHQARRPRTTLETTDLRTPLLSRPPDPAGQAPGTPPKPPGGPQGDPPGGGNDR